jgi:hypothetical protein
MRASFLCFFFLLTGCETRADPGAGPAISRAQLGEEFILALGDSIPLDGTPYSVEFEKVIADSRCRTGATCVWEGNARIQIRLRELATHKPPDGKLPVEGIDLPVELNTSAKFPKEKNVFGLVVELRRLEPRPHVDTTTKGYIATLVARKP